MNKSKLLLIAVCIAPLTACTVTNAKIDSGSIMGDADRCDNSVSVNDGVFSASSVCYKDGELIQPKGSESD
ncbi:hypothetical protein [Vibrio algivorus]|uniref:Lipoprotein n=1 Tax=Vibrio algivorus TaxID=1667024 RepID=A0A557P9N7_9VIBR|nr:hypothetical protein [Vibrio algivorus]TVO37361.1 hypothetical protein FOF44_07055 [Vibrio algivorus]GLT13890.1 hypothetical protein GCM10007931_08640 [Vibrio algivorus]